MSNTTEKTEPQPILPIDPTFLSLSSEYYNINLKDNCEELKHSYNPNIHGLFDVNTIRGFLAVMSSDLDMHSQLPLFQIVPDTFKIPQSDYINNIIYEYNPNCDDNYRMIIGGEQLTQDKERIIRIDVGKIFPGNPCCTEFKKKCPEKCSEYDSRVLLLFCDRLKKYTQHNGSYSDCLKLICENYNSKQEFKVDVRYSEPDNPDSRCYITYICGHSDFREYAFPIFHNNHVIAAIMMGQRIQYKHIKNEAGYCSRNKEFNHDKVVNKDDFKEFDRSKIGEIFNRISEFENIIEDKVKECTQDAISIRFYDIEERFRKGLDSHHLEVTTPDTNTVGDVSAVSKSIDESLNKYKKQLNTTLSDVCDTFFSKGQIYLYAKKLKIYISNNDCQIFELIGKSIRSCPSHPQKILQFPCDFNLTEHDSKDIADKSDPKIELKGENDVLFPKNDFFDDFSILIHESFPEVVINKYGKQYDIFKGHLQSFYHTLFEPYNIMQAAKLNKDLEISMRVTVHEAGNILPTIQKTLYSELKLDKYENDYLEDPRLIPNVHERSLWDLYQRTLLLRDIYKRSTIVFKDIELKKDFHDIHRLVYSIRTLFDVKAEADKFQMIVVNMANVYNHVNLYTDGNLFHQIMFNLVDNAVKYGYSGSNIIIQIPYLAPLESLEKISSMTISVVSFGNEIKEQEKRHIYDLFYRASNTDNSGVEGMGIGLFLVKKMCESLGYSITVNSECIADHHLPAHYFYKKYNILLDNRADEGINKLLASEISNEQLKSVNRDANWNIGFHEMSSIINMPTYKNTFTITFNKNFDDYLILPKNN